ncbi:hypothetical protein [Salinadaptatus halalkaliphilus]|uniref:hypothetical protein n=1 Tax=Salinadaptatus halalkaliphilus TaxID=2419781 RepID=UPI0015812CCE|nr:hypothetical protein [Salinadaptatus halalkaliphilus]
MLEENAADAPDEAISAATSELWDVVAELEDLQSDSGFAGTTRPAPGQRVHENIDRPAERSRSGGRRSPPDLRPPLEDERRIAVSRR